MTWDFVIEKRGWLVVLKDHLRLVIANADKKQKYNSLFLQKTLLIQKFVRIAVILNLKNKHTVFFFWTFCLDGSELEKVA